MNKNKSPDFHVAAQPVNCPHFALLGYPLGHSLSPWLHRRISELAGLTCHYEALALPFDQLAADWPRLARLDGFNLTIPYKEKVQSFLTELSQEAKHLGAVNTVYAGKGYNTDFLALRRVAPDMRGRHVLLLGAGGVARALAGLALESGCESLTVCGRDQEKAQRFLNSIARSGLNPGSPELQACDPTALNARLLAGTQRCDILLQGTAAGMWPRIASLPLPRAILTELLRQERPRVFEAIYNPTATRLALLAKSAGLEVTDGLSMLFWQALEAQKIWRADCDFSAVELMEEQLTAELGWEVLRRSPPRLALSGFMGAGKSLTARRLAERLSIPEAVVDLDADVESVAGCGIPKIFVTEGETGFRRRERAALEECLKAANEPGRPLLLALGGGAILQDGVPELLEEADVMNIFLDVDAEMVLSRLADDCSRPLLAGSAGGADAGNERMFALLEERRPRYAARADYRLPANGDPDAVVETLLEVLGVPPRVTERDKDNKGMA